MSAVFPVKTACAGRLIDVCLIKIVVKQLGLQIPSTWGGTREGAGRKRAAGGGPGHAVRPFHDRTHPLHVTLRVVKGVGSLRRSAVAAVIVARLRTVAHAERFAARRKRFRVVEFSIQTDHLHLLVEARDRIELARGLQGLVGPLARVVNPVLERKGTLFCVRYHARTLETPREVRNAVVYVLANAKKHPEWDAEPITQVERGIDPCSSAPWSRAWAQRPPPPRRLPPVCEAETWLLATGWRRRGLVGRRECPRT